MHVPWVFSPWGTAGHAGGQSLGAPLQKAASSIICLYRPPNRTLMNPSQGPGSSEAVHLPASLVSSQAPHRQPVTYFHAFILPSSSTGLVSLQAACTGTVG